jgi:hypothetical protein
MKLVSGFCFEGAYMFRKLPIPQVRSRVESLALPTLFYLSNVPNTSEGRVRRPPHMPKGRGKPASRKSVLRLPELEQAKSLWE